jgi:hypothetical protein
VDYAHTRSTRIKWHLNPGRRGITVKTNGSAHTQLGVSLIDDRNCCLPVTEVCRNRFQSEKETLMKLGRRQHLRRRLDKDVILAGAPGGPLRL